MKHLVVLLVAACGGGPGAVADAAADVAPPLPDVDPPVDGPPAVVALLGDVVPVHDPSIIATPDAYYVFSTGEGLPIRASTDLVTWTDAGTVFTAAPSWITTTSPGDPDNLWAPDISYFGGQYHLYYAASTFGSNTSCIGHATSPSLAPPVWTDAGPVICSTSDDDWNALDPAAHLDADGQPWLAFGSFWSGLKLIPLEIDGTRQGTDFYSLATRANTAVEAPYLVLHDNLYYLFESVDYCCQGVNSTYKVMVTRASAITGPYVDASGISALGGGGTLVVEGDARWRGPGHNAVLQTPDGDYNVYHSYDANNGGTPTLRISQLQWSADGWPVSAGP